MTRLRSLIKEVLSQPKKKDCNCGCNDCGGKAPILTEGKVKHLISEGLQYHMDKKIQLHESVYRIGSEKHFELIREARALWVRGIIDVSEDDQAILETHLGNFGMYEGEAVPLDMPMVINEELIEENLADLRKWGETTLKNLGAKSMKAVQLFGRLVAKVFDIETRDRPRWSMDWIDILRQIEETSAPWPYDDDDNYGLAVRLAKENDKKREKLLRQGKITQEDIDYWRNLYHDRYGYREELTPTPSDRNIGVSPDMISAVGSPLYRLDGPGDLESMFNKDVFGLSEEENDRFAGSDPKAGSTIQGTGFNWKKKMPSQEEVDKFFSITQNEMHYLNSKPVMGQKGNRVRREIEPWDEYDLSNWNALVRKAKAQGKINEGKYYITRNLGRGQGMSLVKDKEFKSYEDAKEEADKLERGSRNMTAYFVSDRDMNRLDESKKKKKKDPPIGKPKRGGPKAYYVYVRDPKTKRIKKVTFGSGGLRAKIRNPKARNAFAKRHRCSEKNDRTKASYWSCRLPRYAKQLGLGSNMNTFW